MCVLIVPSAHYNLIIAIVALKSEKVFDKILYAFMIKVLDVIELQEIYINTRKVKYDNSAVSIILT